MPSYYNHSDKNSVKAATSIVVSDRLKDGIDVDSMVQDVVKFAKTWTNKSWQEIAEEAQTSVKKAKAAWDAVQKTEEYKLEEQVEPEIKKQLREYDMMKIELMKAWFDSGDDQEKEKYETGYTSKGDIEKRTTETSQRDKKVEYFTEIRLINQERRKLLGIEKHVEINFNQQNNNQFNIEGAGTPLVPEEHEDFISGENSDMPLTEAGPLQIPEHKDE